MEGIKFQYLIILLILCKYPYSSLAFSETSQSVADSLSSLKTEDGSEPQDTIDYINTTVRTPPSLQIQRREESKIFNEKLSELLIFSESSEARFEAQHLFKRNGTSEEDLDSFQYLSQSSEITKWYLVDLNVKLYKAGILPQRDEFDKWFAEVETGSKTINLLDENLESLIQLERKSKDEKMMRYNGTQITFKNVRGDVKNPKKINGVGVTVEKFSGNVEILKDSKGKVTRLGEVDNTKMGGGGGGDNGLLEFRKVIPFEIVELEKIADLTDKIWKDFNLPAGIQPNSVLNEGSSWFQDKMREYRTRFQETIIKPRTGYQTLEGGRGPICYGTGYWNESGCVIIIRKDNGLVEGIKGMEFYNCFGNSSTRAEDRYEMAKLAKNNLDKVMLSPWEKKVEGEDGEGDEDNKELEIIKEKIERLIIREDLAYHARIVDTVNKVQDLDRVKNMGTRSYLDFTERSLRNVPAKVSSYFMVNALTIGANNSQAIGTDFLAKTMVNGLFLGDKSTLAIIQEKIGYGSLEGEGEGSWGTGYSPDELFETSRNFENAAKVLGKVASPMGAGNDYVFGIWSLVKSVERLRNTKDNFERNDVIAGIVHDSIAVATMSGALAVAVAFPPVAPVAAMIALAVHLLSKLAENLYKTKNEVDRINGSIRLSGSEWESLVKERVKGMMVGGRRERDWVDDLLEEKKANEREVQYNLEFLLRNEDKYRGIVFPSRKLEYDGACNFTKIYCLNYACSLSDSVKMRVGTGCDLDYPCPRDDSEYTCGTFRENIVLRDKRVSVDFYQFECLCDNKTRREEFEVKGRENSLVDLRERREVFWERAVPGDVRGAGFLCKPGKGKYMGWKISEMGSRMEYLCDGAIGVMLEEERWREGQVILIDLGEGDDRVYLGDGMRVGSLFRMGGCGDKRFFGGGGRNEFVFEGGGEKCREGKELGGFLRGGKLENDTISLMRNYSRGKGISVDFREGWLKRVGGEEEGEVDRIVVTFESVEEFVGREGEVEVVIVNCSTRALSLRGGNVGGSDSVVIPGNGENDTCVYNLKVMLGQYSNLDSEAMEGEITLLVDSPFEPELEASFDVYPGNEPKVSVRFMKTGCRDMIHDDINVGVGTGDDEDDEQNIILMLRSVKELSISEPVKITFRGKNLTKEELQKDILVHFGEMPEGGSLFSEMRISGKGRNKQRTEVYHLLPQRNPRWEGGSGPLERFGSGSYTNIFEVTGSDWVIHGGAKTDVFLLKARPLELHGGGGGDGFNITTTGKREDQDEDVVWLHEDLNEPVGLDLTSDKFTGIGSVQGWSRKRLNVTCACDTNMVIVYGGPERGIPNVVRIPQGQNCGKRGWAPPLHIVARGSSRVEVLGEVKDFYRDGVGITVFSAEEEDEDDVPLWFEFEGGKGNLNGVHLTIQLSHKNWRVKGMRREGNYVTCELRGESVKFKKKEEMIKLKLATNWWDGTSEGFLLSPNIHVKLNSSLSSGEKREWLGQVFIDKDSGILRMMYRLVANTDPPKYKQIVEGFLGIPNIFRINRTRCDVTGGKEDDVFVIFLGQTAKDISIDGGEGGDNTLILEANLKDGDSKEITVDLEKGEFYFFKKNKGKLKGIQNIVGMVNRQDKITTNCFTKTVNGRGGDPVSEKGDEIEINDGKCKEPMDLTVDTGKGNTTVINEARRGSFIYNVRDFATTELKLEILDENEHLINFHFDPWTVIGSIKTEKKSEGTFEITFELKKNGSEIKKSFKMAAVDNKTGDFHNPIFRFHPENSPVTSDLRVQSESGSVAATFILYGRGLNKYEGILGLQVNENRFLLNATRVPSGGGGGGGFINGSSKSVTNQFWIYQLSSPLDNLEGGKRDDEKCKNCSNNYLHFYPSLLPNDDLEIDLDVEHGWLMKRPIQSRHSDNDDPKAKGELVISHIQNIAEFHGRNHSAARDTAYVTCHTKKVHQIDQLYIRSNISSDCPPYNLIIIIGKKTSVKFIGTREEQGAVSKNSSNSSSSSINHKFHYKFTIPISFNVDYDIQDKQGSQLVSISGHTYYLPFNLDDLTYIHFNLNEKRLYYSLSSTGEVLYSHNMISNTFDSDEFYQQPVMVTQDKFKIMVYRTKSIILSLGATTSSWPTLDYIQTKIIPSFVRKARELKVTIMMETKNEFLYIGENSSFGEARNVLENRVNLTSHLVGSGGPKTIYNIKSVKNSIYIYSGLEDSKQFCMRVGDDNCPYHTIDLSDAIMPIRMEKGTKYIPEVVQHENNLVLFIEDGGANSNANLTIINGAMEKICKRFQVLIESAMLHFFNERGSWTLDPKPVVVPQGYVYSVSALELENGQNIKLDRSKEGGIKLNASTFTAAQYGYDLYLTDIKAMAKFQKKKKIKVDKFKFRDEENESDKGYQQATTIIITDFYKTFDRKGKGDYKFNEYKERSRFSTSSNVVIVSLPGLNVILKGNKVWIEVTTEEKEDEFKDKRGRRKREVEGQGLSKGVLQEASLMEWKCVLHDVEENLLIDMPDIPRLYYRKECVDRFWLIVGIVTGVVFGGMFFIFVVVKRKEIREKMRRIRERMKCKKLDKSGKKVERKGSGVKAVVCEKDEKILPQFIPESGNKNTDEFLELFEKWADGQGFDEQERKQAFREALPSAVGIAWWSSRSRDVLNEAVSWGDFKKDFVESVESVIVTKFRDGVIATTSKKRWGWGFSKEGKFCVLTLNKPREISDIVKLVGDSANELVEDDETDGYRYIDEMEENEENFGSKVVEEREEVERDVGNVRIVSDTRKLISIAKRKSSKKIKTGEKGNSKGNMVEGAILVKSRKQT